jgi:hypothetical protein
MQLPLNNQFHSFASIEADLQEIKSKVSADECVNTWLNLATTAGATLKVNWEHHPEFTYIHTNPRTFSQNHTEKSLDAAVPLVSQLSWGETNVFYQHATHVLKIVGPIHSSLLVSAIRFGGTLKLIDEGGFSLHAAACQANDEQTPMAWVAMGQSGAGKTTLANEWLGAGMQVINDDHIFVELLESDYSFQSGPWSGREGLKPQHGLKSKLTHVFFLEQASAIPNAQNQTIPMFGMAAYRKIMQSVVCYSNLPVSQQRCLDNVLKWVQSGCEFYQWSRVLGHYHPLDDSNNTPEKICGATS